MIPNKNDTGKTVARITKYVGLQAEKIGPSDAPMIASPQTLFFLYPFANTLFDLMLKVLAKENFSHRSGKTMVKPNKKMIPPEIHFQKSCGILTNKELALRISVNSTIEIPSDATTTKSLLLLGLVSVIECPTITGSNGRMHGASTVNTPATNEISSNNMLFYFCNKRGESLATTPFFDQVAILINLHKCMLVRNTVLLFERGRIVVINVKNSKT